MRRLATAALVALSWTAGTALAGDQWNQFRGPGGRGIAGDAAALPVEFGESQNLLWKVPLPAGISSPVLWDDRVFLTASQDEKLETICIDRRSGEVRWRNAVAPGSAERLQRLNSPAAATPATDGERVFVYFGSLGLLCYDLEGVEQWRREIPTPRNLYGTAASPILAGGRLIFVHDSQEESYLEAIEPASGETVWRREREGFKSSWSTPAIWQRDGVPELLVYGVWWLKAYDLRDGTERWSVPGLTDEPIIVPATGDGLVFVTSYNMNSNPEVIGLPEFAELLEQHDTNGDGQLDRQEAEANQSVLSRFDADGEGDHPLRIFFAFLDEDRDGQITETEWGKVVRWLNDFEHVNAVLALRPGAEDEETEIAWQHSQGVPECPSPLHYRGRLYLVKNGGIASCLDARTGAVRYQGRLDSRGPCYSSPVAGDGKIYSASARGVITVFAADDELRVLAHNDLGERIMATPALQGGCVYVRSESHLWAFGSAE